MAIVDRMRKVWNAFVSSEQAPVHSVYGASSSYSSGSPSRTSTRTYNDRSILTSICTRISIDVSDAFFVMSSLTNGDDIWKTWKVISTPVCLGKLILIKSPRAFRQDIARTVLDRGVAAIVPVDTTVNPDTMEVFDIFSLRVGTIVQWYADHIRVDVWNEKTGKRQEIILPKRYVGIIENPLYSVMNEQNSTFQTVE